MKVMKKLEMKKIFCLVICALMIFALASCGSKSVVGKWESGANTYEFKKDGTFTSSFNGVSASGTYEVEDGKLSITYTGLLGISKTTEFTYTIDGDKLSLTGDISLLGSTSITVEYTKVK